MKGNPVYKREITVSSRSIRLPIIMLIFNCILALAAFLNMYSVTTQVEVTAEISYSSFLQLYVFLTMTEFLMLLFIMPALTAGSISGEREKQTLNLMLSTQMTPGQIVFGKLLSSMFHMVLLVFSSFPVISLVFVYGGIRLKDLALLLLLYFSVALLSASFGIGFSAVCRRSTVATAMSYGFLVFLLAGTYVVNVFIRSITQMGRADYVNQVGLMTSQANSGVFFYLLLLNPALTFSRVIGSQVGNQTFFIQVIQQFGNRLPNLVLEAWVPVSIGFQILLSGIFLMIAVRAIDPSPRKSGKRKRMKGGL